MQVAKPKVNQEGVPEKILLNSCILKGIKFLEEVIKCKQQFCTIIFKYHNMKKIFLSVVCLLAVCIIHAQSFGVISYTLPEGWISSRLGSDMELVKSGAENSGCKIILYKQVSTAITTEKQFADVWATKTTVGNTAIQKKSIPVKTAGDGWISISATKTSGNNTEGFYTLCDSSLTAIILTQSPNSACAKEIQSIMATFNIPVKNSNPNLRAKSKKTKFPYVYR
jgi:hypothetical protein